MPTSMFTSVAIVVFSACASAPEDPFVTEETVEERAPATVDTPDPIHLQWTVLPVERQKDAEHLGRIAVAMEATLYQTVVPQGPGGAPPAVTYVPTTHAATLELRMDDDRATEASFCTEDGICEIYRSDGSPEEIGVGLARQALDRLGLPTPALNCLTEPPSENAYATMMAGRSAAIIYGLLEPSDNPGDKRADPVARSVFLDPKSAGSQWLATRAAWQRDDLEAMAQHAIQAAQRCPTHDGWAADEALAVSLSTHRARPFPKGPRFAAAEIDAAYARNAPETYGLVVDARARWPQSALLVRRAADTAPNSKLDGLLHEWSKIDKNDPEPVRRAAARAIFAADWKGLLKICDELERRGDDASHLAVPALLALGRVEEAAIRSPPELRPLLAARSGEAALGTSPEMMLLRAERRVESDPIAALSLARRALAYRPTWPEALSIAAKASANAGKDPGPYLVRLAEAEP